jgi:hypothetical protein
MKPTRKKAKGRKHAPRAAPPREKAEKAAPAKKDVDDFVEGLDDPDEDYERGVEEVVRLTHADAGRG